MPKRPISCHSTAKHRCCTACFETFNFARQSDDIVAFGGRQQNAVQVDRRCAQTPLVSEISGQNIRQQRSRCKHVSKLRQSLMPTTPKILDLVTFKTSLAPVVDAVGHMRTRQLRTDQ